MTFPTKRRPWLRLPLAVFALAALLVCPAGQAAKEDAWAWPNRDNWQRPEQVMDVLGVKLGSLVADVGCGDGYFTFHLASRVGPQGKVYAVDVQPKEVQKVRSRALKEHLPQVEPVLGAPDDPRRRPESLDAILLVRAYHEMAEYDAMLAALRRALKPGALLGIIDEEGEAGKARKELFERHRIQRDMVKEDAARNGFRFLREETGFTLTNENRNYYFLVFEKPR